MLNEGFVYRISAPGSNSVYVGQTVDPKTRFRQHKRAKVNPALNRFLKKHSDAVLYSWPVFDMDAEEIAEEQLCRDMGFNILNCAPCGGVSPMLGRKHTVEARAKMSVANLKRMSDPKERAKLSAAVSKRMSDPEVRAKMGARRKGRKLSHEHRANIGASLSKYLCDPEVRKKIGAASKARMSDPKVRENLSIMLKGVPWSNARRAAYAAN